MGDHSILSSRNASRTKSELKRLHARQARRSWLPEPATLDAIAANDEHAGFICSDDFDAARARAIGVLQLLHDPATGRLAGAFA